MALGKTTAFQSRAFAIMLVVMASSVACGPASAQYYWSDRSSGGWGGWGWGGRSSGGWGDRYPSDRYYRRSPRRDFLSPFSGERRNRPAPTADYSKAPSPRKLETPPSQTAVVIGDSMADWLGYGLDESYAEQPEIGVERKIRRTSGLVRYDAKNEALDWPQAAKDALSNAKPNAIVVMLGLNDRVPLSEKAPAQPKRNGEPAQGANQSAGQASQDKAAPAADAEAQPQTAGQTASQHLISSGPYDFHTEQWSALYAKRVDAMIAALKSKGVPVIWVGLPAIRGTKSTARTPEQTEAVTFWENVNFGPAWQAAARELSIKKEMPLAECARLFALLNMSLANAYIVNWDAKYFYKFWRPVTAIRNGDQDGNDATERDPGWTSLIPTPLHPEYPSQATINATIASAVLESVFGPLKAVPFTATDVRDSKRTRQFASLADMAEEQKNVRVWGGVHYRFAIRTSEEVGPKVAAYMIENTLKPVR